MANIKIKWQNIKKFQNKKKKIHIKNWIIKMNLHKKMKIKINNNNNHVLMRLKKHKIKKQKVIQYLLANK